MITQASGEKQGWEEAYPLPLLVINILQLLQACLHCFYTESKQFDLHCDISVLLTASIQTDGCGVFHETERNGTQKYFTE